MSVWKRELFKWTRGDPRRDRPTSPAVVLGQVDSNSPAAKSLHSAASSGRRKEVLRYLQTGVSADTPNDAGQTPLFLAAYYGHQRVVELLLQHGANPNEKSKSGMTPVHVACFSGSLRTLIAMIEAGGDLRLHDNQGNTCMDWAKRQPDPKRRMKMMEFLQKSQLFALGYSGEFPSVRGSHSVERPPSILQLLRSKVGSHISLESNSECLLHRVRSHGFGQVYYGGDAPSGLLSVIPLITENMLTEDDQGVSFDISSHFIMTSMKWNMTQVTVKRSDKFAVGEGYVDLLISEVEHLGKLHHPNILLLMGLCQTPSLDAIMPVFERVGLGSLHYILYEKMDRMPMTYIRDVARQVCEALVFMHNQNYLHCNLSSHAIFLVSMHQTKVGGLEYMLERKKAEAGHGSAALMARQKDQINRWMSPELMMGHPLSTASDVYSYCIILWEMIAGEMPWKSLTATEIFEKVTLEQEQLSILEARTPLLFRGILEKGLMLDPAERLADFCMLLCWLQGPIDKTPGWKSSSLDRLMTLRRESDQRICVGGPSAERSDLADGKDHDASSSSRDQRRSSIGSDGRQGSYSVSQQTSRTSCNWNDVDGRQGQGGSTTADINNHYRLDLMKVTGDVTDSYSPFDDNGSNEYGSCKISDGEKGFARNKNSDQISWGKMERQEKPPLAHQNSKVKFCPDGTDWSSSSGHGSRNKRRSCPVQKNPAFLPNVYGYRPRISNAFYATESQAPYLEISAQEGDCKFLPPVKPASHSTDVKDFFSGDTQSGPKLQQPAYSQKADTLPRNHYFFPRSPRLPRSRSAVSRPSSAHCADTKVNEKLSHQGSVRSLAEQFQAYCYNHSLRQSILRGSAVPQGTCSDDMSLLFPDRIKNPPDGSSGPGQLQTSPSDSQQDLKRDECTSSTQGSSESLTTVSYQGSLPDLEDTPRRKTKAARLPDDSAVVPAASVGKTCLASEGERDLAFSSKLNTDTLWNSTATCQDSEKKDFLGATSCEVTATSGRPRTWGTITQGSLRPRFSRSDISNEYFDFREYYIDDEVSSVWGNEPVWRTEAKSESVANGGAHHKDVATKPEDDQQSHLDETDDAVVLATTENAPPAAAADKPTNTSGDDKISASVRRTRRSKSDTALKRVKRAARPQQPEDALSDSPSPDQEGCFVLNLERSCLTDEESQEKDEGDTKDNNDSYPEEANSLPSSRPLQSESKVHEFFLQPADYSMGYTATLRVESSLQNPGCHHITTTACDQATGATTTVHEETVQACKLRTTLGIR